MLSAAGAVASIAAMAPAISVLVGLDEVEGGDDLRGACSSAPTWPGAAEGDGPAGRPNLRPDDAAAPPHPTVAHRVEPRSVPVLTRGRSRRQRARLLGRSRGFRCRRR